MYKGNKSTHSTYNNDHYPNKSARMHKRNDPNDRILPSPSMLESYEEISPGITESISMMVEKEQQHRHALETRRLNIVATTDRIMRFLACVTAIVIIYSTILCFKQSGSIALSAVICAGGFAFLVFSRTFKTIFSPKHKKRRYKNYGRPRRYSK